MPVPRCRNLPGDGGCLFASVRSGYILMRMIEGQGEAFATKFRERSKL